MDEVKAPFTADQVASLNGFQIHSMMHPFTCGEDICRRKNQSVLYALEDGWHCWYCDYTQDWAHGYMTDRSWETAAKAILKVIT